MVRPPFGLVGATMSRGLRFWREMDSPFDKQNSPVLISAVPISCFEFSHYEPINTARLGTTGLNSREARRVHFQANTSK
jgi:hypothetical protein